MGRSLHLSFADKSEMKLFQKALLDDFVRIMYSLSVGAVTVLAPCSYFPKRRRVWRLSSRREGESNGSPLLWVTFKRNFLERLLAVAVEAQC